MKSESWSEWWVKVLPNHGEKGSLTEGEMYKVLVDGANEKEIHKHDKVMVKDDEGKERYWFKSRFTKMGIRIWDLKDIVEEIRKEIYEHAKGSEI